MTKNLQFSRQAVFTLLASIFLVGTVIGAVSSDATASDNILRITDLRQRIISNNIEYRIIALEEAEVRETLDEVEEIDEFITKIEEHIAGFEDYIIKSFFDKLLDPYRQQRKELQKAAVRLEFEKSILLETLTRNAEELFYLWLFLDRQEKALLGNLRFLDEVTELEKELHAQGVTTRLEVERAEIRLEQGHLMADMIKGQKDNTLDRLKMLIGHGLDRDLRLVDPGSPDTARLNRAEAVRHATREGLSVRMQERLYEIDPGEVERLRLEQARLMARLQVEERYRTARFAQEAYNLEQRSFELAEENLRRAKARYDAGLISGLELIEAYTGLMEALDRYYEARVDYAGAQRDYFLARQGIPLNDDF
jgi:outer membrane protein TolC